jgi:hypothetical protein
LLSRMAPQLSSPDIPECNQTLPLTFRIPAEPARRIGYPPPPPALPRRVRRGANPPSLANSETVLIAGMLFRAAANMTVARCAVMNASDMATSPPPGSRPPPGSWNPASPDAGACRNDTGKSFHGSIKCVTREDGASSKRNPLNPVRLLATDGQTVPCGSSAPI